MTLVFYYLNSTINFISFSLCYHHQLIHLFSYSNSLVALLTRCPRLFQSKRIILTSINFFCIGLFVVFNFSTERGLGLFALDLRMIFFSVFDLPRIYFVFSSFGNVDLNAFCFVFFFLLIINRQLM